MVIHLIIIPVKNDVSCMGQYALGTIAINEQVLKALTGWGLCYGNVSDILISEVTWWTT